MTLLLACLVAAAFMAGLSWFVGAVHYPLFAGVGAGEWAAYHRRHSARTALVVVPPMVTELVTSAWIVADRPAHVATGLAIAGLGLALTTWALTAHASRLHGRLGAPPDPRTLRALLGAHHARTALWTAHAMVVAVMAAQLAPA